MLVSVLLFVLGLILLIKGGDWFVDGAVSIAHRFKVPELIIGATVVSVGTTLPEVMVSATSAVNGHGEIAYGNAIGSIICNTALIAAITVSLRPSSVDPKSLRMPVIFFFTAAGVYAVNAYLTGYFSRTVGIALLLIFVFYMFFTIRQGLKKPLSKQQQEVTLPEEDAPKQEKMLWSIIKLVVGAALIAIGADLLVDHGTVIARELGVPESVIALTFVALGTSLPELVTAITSLVKGHSALSLGNIIGANIFNLVLVSGLSTVLSPFEVPQSSTLFGRNTSLVLDIPVMLTVMLLLVVPALVRKKLSRVQGILLLCIYAGFCAVQFIIS